MRSPIQCEGIERGHRRMSAVAVSGSVNPQSIWGDLAGGLASVASSFIPLPGAPIWGPLAVGAIKGPIESA